MALTDMVLIPGADYQGIADQLRALSGTTAVITSGEAVGLLEEANGDIAEQSERMDALIEQANGLPDAGSAALERCSVDVEMQGIGTGCSIAYTLVTNGAERNLVFNDFPVANIGSAKKGSLIVIYCPGNTKEVVTGGVALLEASPDRAMLVFEVTGDGTITVS